MFLAGPFYAAAILLVVAGAQKVADPKPLVRALKTLRLPLPGPVVRLGAVAELGIGLLALLHGGVVSAAALAASYALFTGVVLLGLRRGGVLASCGCFGKRDLPPTRTHALVTGSVAVGALYVVTATPGPLHRADALLPLAFSTLALVVVGYLVLAVLPLLTLRAPARSAA